MTTRELLVLILTHKEPLWSRVLAWVPYTPQWRRRRALKALQPLFDAVWEEYHWH